MNAPNLPPFVALSYVWGDLEDTLPLDISGCTFQVTRNLDEIIHHLSASKFDQLLWIDALCINQRDLRERTSQVALMGDIYSRAKYVLAFLSAESEPYDLALDIMEQTANDPELHFDPSLLPHLTVRGLNTGDEALRDSLIGFFAAPWWTRVWTVQEFLLAQEVRFQCGNRLINAGIVQKSCQTWINHDGGCCWAARRASDGNVQGLIYIPSEPNGGLAIYNATLRMKYLMDMSHSQERFDFLAAIRLFRIRQCANPRDRIFGFSGLRLQGIDIKSVLPADYTVTPARLYRDLAMVLIQESQTLDVLSHVLHDVAPQKKQKHTPGLPSWVPDWDAPMDDSYHLIYTERTDIIRHLNASRNMKPDWKLDTSGSITTRGLHIAKVEATAPGYPTGGPDSTLGGAQLIHAWRRLAGLPADPEALPSEDTIEGKRERAFQNAICGGMNTMPWEIGSCAYSRAYQTWLEWFVHADQANLPRTLKEATRDIDDLVQQVSLRRRFILTDDGQVGFGPGSTQEGDDVVILPGGKLPYVFRRVHSNSTPTYRLVGDAYINGVMAGERVDPESSPFERMILV